jgi:hypothetical protein
MKRNKLALYALMTLSVLQIAYAASKIADIQKLESSGHVFRFKTTASNLMDALRGPYLHLNFTGLTVVMDRDFPIENGEMIFAEIAEDSAGYAFIASISKSPFSHTERYVQATVSSFAERPDNRLDVWIQLPFDRWYKSDVRKDEENQWENVLSGYAYQPLCAIVYLRNGKGIVKEVLIDQNPQRDKIR